MEPSNGVSQQCAEVNALNSKLGYDEQLDNRREVLGNDRAWEDLKLRKAQNASTFDHFINMTTAGSTATAQQTGQTENEQTTSPIRTGVGDNLAAGALPANRAIDSSTALGQAAITANVANALALYLAAQAALMTGTVSAAAPTPAAS